MLIDGLEQLAAKVVFLKQVAELRMVVSSGSGPLSLRPTKRRTDSIS